MGIINHCCLARSNHHLRMLKVIMLMWMLNIMYIGNLTCIVLLSVSEVRFEQDHPSGLPVCGRGG